MNESKINILRAALRDNPCVLLGADENGDHPRYYFSDSDLADAIRLVLAADNAESSSMEVRIPKGFYNIGISCDHHIYGDTNDSANWNRFEIPLKTPKGKWIITKHEKLEDCELLELTDR